MLRTGRTHQQETGRHLRQLLMFSVGGRRLAAKTSDISSISRWTEAISVAGRTPFVTAVVRQGHSVLPIFDLAAFLRLTVQGGSPLCLRVKHPLGDMAMCIDEVIPVLHLLDPAALRSYEGDDLPAEGSYTDGLEVIPILSVSRLGSAA